MRVLVIGFPLPNPEIDNHNLLTAPSWFDYAGLVVEPESVSAVIEDVLNRREEYQSGAGEPVLNRPTNPLAVGLGDVVKRRRVETAQLLANGGVVVVFARPGVVHEGVAGFAGCDRYAWLPAPAGVVYDAPFLVRAEGTEIRITDSAHPFAGLLERYRRWIAYRARIDDATPGFAAYGRVFARSVGGAVIGADLSVGGGHVIFLPALTSIAYGDQRFELAGAMLEALRRRVAGDEAAAPPEWVSRFSLPNSELLEANEADAAVALSAAETRLAETRSELQSVTRFRALLWQEGSRGLDAAVREALRVVGFDVEPDIERPGWIADGGVRAFFEVEGSTEAVLEWPYFRLQKRLEKDLLDSHQPKHGLLVVNGQRLLPPEERTVQFSETLGIAAENYRYGLLTTQRLFEMVRAVLSHPDDEDLRSTLRSQLLTSTGVISSPGLPALAEPA